MNVFKFLFFTALLFFVVQLQAQPLHLMPPRPATYEPINDITSTLDANKLRPLRDSLIAYEKRTSTQIVVVVVNTLSGYSVEEYATTLYNHWGIGQSEKQNNGVLFLVALVDRKIRIEVGYGLEASLTDAYCAGIIDDKIKPLFKESKYEEGIVDGVYSAIARADSSSFFRANARINISFIEQYWFRLLIAIVVFAYFFRKSIDMLLQHIVYAAIFLFFTDTLFWNIINMKGEAETPQTAAFIGSLISLVIWIPALIYLNKTGTNKKNRPISPVANFIYFGFALACINIFGLAFIDSLGYTLFINIIFAIWAYCFERHTKKENTDVSKLPLLSVAQFRTEFTTFTCLALSFFIIIIFVLEAIGLAFMQHFLVYAFCFIFIVALLPAILKQPPRLVEQKKKTYKSKKTSTISTNSSYNDYSDYSDYSDRSSYNDYSDRSSYSDYSDSSWGGGSSGGGGASGSW